MKTIYKLMLGTLIITLCVITVIACSSTKSTYTDADTEGMDDLKIEKSGALLWGEACNRCHLAPSPADYNDTDWEIISLHMRVRANLTYNEITKIEEFLKSAN